MKMLGTLSDILRIAAFQEKTICRLSVTYLCMIPINKNLIRHQHLEIITKRVHII